MTQEEYCDATLTPAEVQFQIEEEHGHTDGMSEFTAERGTHATYSGQDVLDWLGY